MRIDLAPEDLVFREEVRAFLREKLPPDIKRKVDNGVSLRRDDIMRWHRILYERGWVAPNWPAEWGGPGWTIERKYIWDEEQGLAGAPRLIDRKSVVEGKRVSVRVDLGGRRLIKKKKKNRQLKHSDTEKTET